ncbi:hypothetical protein LPB140_09160 [Sphingorhabdus lutea]|uniref:5-oxoprolinase subunit PxpA n=1 Tax=Sphingorhabdus lutea TaxID=1913578 RepID=A0A1L3JCP5_9SPHN|nr:5-oxoprolinase subunit PxpA [Sphingorhabdus lutea]APG62927.1 hypothetical protein LPB140_09160 [Sphingorhabdus lutea]
MANIDLNCDLGEDSAAESQARDIKIMDVVSSVNIACGGHAGDEFSMAYMMKEAAKRGVAIGAHPSFPDTQNFGRKEMIMTSDQLSSAIISQLEIFADIAHAQNIVVRHVKPHGALYNIAARNAEISHIICAAVAEIFPNINYYGLAGSQCRGIAAQYGLKYIDEAFADRRYNQDKSLVQRSEPDAILHDVPEQSIQALNMALGRPILDKNGADLTINAQSLCLHSDSNDALKSAQAIYQILQENGISIQPI